MRQKKSKLIYYIVAFALLACFICIATHEISPHIEHVEQPLPNTFLSK